MVDIHNTAIVHSKAELDEGVSIGAYSIIGENVKIGRNTLVGPHVVIDGWTSVGERNKIFQFASIGSIPQDLKYKGEKTTLKIGDGNIIREYVTMNPGTTGGGGITTIGNNCIIGAGSVVRGQFPDDSVIVGNPAQVIMKTSVQKMLFRQNPGLVKTNNIPKSECTRLIKKHFGIS